MSQTRPRFVVIAVLCLTFAALSAQAQFGDVTVSKSGPAIAPEGTDVSYDVTVTNIGANAASTVQLNDPIPPGMTFVSAPQNNGVAFVCTNPGVGNPGTVNCSTATLGAGQSANFTFVFNIGTQASPGQEFVNTATVSTTPGDDNPNNNSASATTRTLSSDIVVSKSGPAEAAAGADVAYDITLYNAGPDAAPAVKLDDSIPAGMTFVSAGQNAGPAFTCSTPAANDTVGTVTCNSVAPFLSGATATFTITFQIPPATPAGTYFTNTAISTSATDPESENDVASATTSTPPPPQSDVGITKNAPGSVGPDTDLTYTITVTNAGAPANVQWQDTLPGNLTFVSLNQSGTAMSCTTPSVGAGGSVMCNATGFPGNGVSTFSLTVHVPAGTASGTSYQNNAVASGSNADPNPENNTASAFVVVSSVDVSITKTGNATVTAGTNVSYILTVANAGQADVATDVVLTDTLPAGTTFVSVTQDNGPSAFCSNPGSGNNGSVVCTMLTLPSGASAQFTLVINSGSTVTIANTATVTTSSFDTNNGNNSSTANTSVTQSANVGVAKSGPATITAGTQISYSVTATNSGPSHASTVSLTDVVPANTTFASRTQNSGPTFTCTDPAVGGTGTITCNIATLNAGASATFTFVFNVSPAAGGSIDNTANISTTTTDPTPGNNSSFVSATVTQSANLGVTKTGPGNVAAGSPITYTVTATNGGPSDASTVSLTDTVPANTTFVSATQPSGPTFACTQPAVGGTGTITCNIATLAAGASATFTFVFNVSPAATGSINNTANLSSATTDPTPGNNTSTTSTPIGQSADLTVVKNGPAVVTAGSNITYTVTASNAGPSDAANVSLTDVVPANTTFVSATQTSGPPFICATPPVGSPGTITCTIATFAASATSVFSFVVNLAPAATGTVSNTAAITSTTPDPTPGNSSGGSSAAIGAGPTDVSITKTANAASYMAGSNATFTITVTNNGPGNAAGTTVTDVLPAGTTFVSATPTQGSCTGTTTVVCTIGALAPAATATITLVVKLPQTVGSISNTATVAIANTETAPANNTSTAAINVIAEIPALSPLALLLLAMLIAGVGVVMKR